MVPNNFYYLDDPTLVCAMIDMRRELERIADADADLIMAELDRQYLEPCRP